MKITFVKKILANGSPCPKCRDVAERLERAGHMGRIDDVLIADERDPASPGMRLAARLGVVRAPFFVVSDKDSERVYTVYLRFVKEVLGGASAKRDEARETLRDHPDLDLL